MLLKRNNCEFKLPERIKSATCRFGIWSDGDPMKNPSSYLIAINQVSLGDALKMSASNESLGIPTVFAVGHGADADFLRLWPTPDADYHARLRYNPAVKEI